MHTASSVWKFCLDGSFSKNAPYKQKIIFHLTSIGTLVGGFMKSFHGNDYGCLLNKKVGLWCPYQHIQRAPKSYAAPLSYADLSDFYTRDFLLWFSTSNISAPFNWKIPKPGMGNNTNPIAKFFLWSMAEIPTMSENKARESGIFGFPWFQPCLFSQKRWGTETWPGNIKLTGVIGESPKKFHEVPL